LKKKISLSLLLIFIIFLISLKSNFLPTFASPGLTCQLKSGNCLASETCIFSLNRTSNSHAGDCNYGSLKVCCSDTGATLIASIKSTPCNPSLNEAGVISLNKTSNSHAEEYQFSNYPYHVCLNSTPGSISCIYKNSCDDPGETCLASLNLQTNSHLANCSDPNYLIKICCVKPDCGNGVIEATEECDLPDWGTCQPYENCNATCQCHDFRNETRGCNYYDMCSASPCTWWTDCYVNTTDDDYKQFILTQMCNDAVVVPHAMKTCPWP